MYFWNILSELCDGTFGIGAEHVTLNPGPNTNACPLPLDSRKTGQHKSLCSHEYHFLFVLLYGQDSSGTGTTGIRDCRAMFNMDVGFYTET